jgi:geranylgeranyl pyrophosphate synthase
LGAEEKGVTEIPPVRAMIEAVHRIRGGLLFSMAFIGPRLIEPPRAENGLSSAEAAAARLGTAFQIVDDLVDFEQDLVRGSHNLLRAHITHHGTQT